MTGCKLATAWSLALLLAAIVIGQMHYRTRDPDSLLYARIASDLARRPMDLWIAPQWPPGAYMQGLFREHPAGLFILPALLARLGYPGEQAAYVTNALYQMLTLLLLPLLAARFVAGHEARPLAWLLQIIPIAFAYRIRANHEQPVLLCLVAALYATERSRRNPAWALVSTAALVALAGVKGMVAVPALLACAWWLFAGRSHEAENRTPAGAWLGVAFAAGSLALGGLAYEAAYREATGESFVAYYATRQGPALDDANRVATVAYNLFYYCARVLWFAFPWSLPAAALVVSAVAALLRGTHPKNESEAGARRGARLALGVAALYVVAFSFSDRRAERYVFPAYFLVASCGAVAWMRSSAWFRRFLTQAERLEPYLPLTVWVATFALHLLGGILHLPRIKIWTPD